MSEQKSLIFKFPRFRKKKDKVGSQSRASSSRRDPLESGQKPLDSSQRTNDVSSSSQRELLESGPQPLDTPSKSQRTREAAIILLDFGTIISEATDLLKPMKMICGFIKKALEVAKSVEKVDEDWNNFIRRLKFHIAAIESQTSSLEEDQSMDESPPPLSPDIEKALQVYISVLNAICEQLNTVYEQWQENKSDGLSRMKKTVDVDHNAEVITQKTRELDDAFQQYTVALSHLVAKKVDQIQQELAQFRVEFKHEVKVAHSDRLKDSNVYGNQHLQCLDGTRVRTLSTIRQWANDETTTNRIFGLLDVAGSGKSTVAKHMVEEWKKEGRLIGRFFFSRDTTETMSTRLFCSTISDAFAGCSPAFKSHVEEFKEQPDWAHLSFEEQFEGLVASPLRQLNMRAILTIDALDECEDRMKVLKTLRDKQSSIPFLRTFITGRLEADIKEWAQAVEGIRVTNFRDLDDSNRDVDKYIRYRLQKMPDLHDRVIHRADGLFIWARIACDLLAEAADTDGLLLELEGSSEGDAKLDSIYRVALQQATPKDRSSQRAMIIVLQMILATKEPLSIAKLEKLSPWSGRDVVEKIVTRLGSLLLYRDREDPIRLLHATIREFLTARQRAGVYYIQIKLGHYTLASESMKFLRHRSSFDIYKWDETSRRKEISLRGFLYLL